MYINYMNYIANGRPDAVAYIKGGKDYPDIRAKASFYAVRDGVLVYTEANGLPAEPPYRVFGYHIHEGISCTGNPNDPFANSLGHYNPTKQPHPCHAGDLPPLFSNNGYALGVVLTSRFVLGEVLGKTIIIHEQTDDFVSQPSGNSGKKIACGEIEPT